MTRAARAALAAALLVLFSTPSPADEPVRGRADATVTVLVFSAFGCPYCAEAETQLQSLRARYGERLEIVFKHYPLGSDREAYLPHEAALAAGEQGRFWAMHDRLFAEKGRVGRETALRLAREIGLDEAKFAAALDSRRFQAPIDRDLAEARALKVRAAPTFFIDGLKLEGLQTLETMEQVVGFRMKGGAAAASAAATPVARPSPR
jgi:protein-disulfide isomerase